MPICGSCHCGKIAYTLDAVPTEAIECNCSICRRRGAVLAAFSPDKFHLETARRHRRLHLRQACHPASILQDLAVRAVRRGTGPDGEAMVAINLAAENLDLSTIRITQFDGQACRAAEVEHRRLSWVGSPRGLVQQR